MWCDVTIKADSSYFFLYRDKNILIKFSNFGLTIISSKTHQFACPVKNGINVRFQNHPPPPIGPIGGGSSFWIFCVNFCATSTKIFLGRILGMLGSWPEFFGSLSVFCWEMGGVKIKTTKKLRFLPKMTKIRIQKKKMRNDHIVHPTSLIWPQNS